jgi:hypothetical protein
MAASRADGRHDHGARRSPVYTRLEQISKLDRAHVRVIEDAGKGSALHWIVKGDRHVAGPVLHSHVRAFCSQLRPAGALEGAHEVDPAHDGKFRAHRLDALIMRQAA